MSARSYAVRDSITMLRRDVTHSLRFPMMSVSGILTPIAMLLLFAGVGRTLRSGLGGFGGAGGGGGYIDFLTPVIDTFRGLMTGGPVGRDGSLAVAWCVGLAMAGYLWSRALYDRGPAHRA